MSTVMQDRTHAKIFWILFTCGVTLKKEEGKDAKMDATTTCSSKIFSGDIRSTGSQCL